MSANPGAITAILVGMIGSVAVFGFLGIAWWADARRREREAFYRSEVLKKLAEAGEAGSSAALEMYRDQQRTAARNRLESQRLAGLILTAVGVGVSVLLKGLVSNEAWRSGLIPTLIGAVLLAYSYLLAPRSAA